MTEELENIMPNEQNESDVQQEELRIPAESDLSLEEPNHLEEVDFEGTESGVVEDVEGEDVKQPEAPASENLATKDEICEGEPCELQEGGKRKKRKKRRKIDEYTLENDIRYRGPLSYMHLRMLAWAFLIIAQIGVLLSLGARFDANLGGKLGMFPDVLKMASDIMMPLFLMATFATILNGSKTFKSMLILYGGISVVIYLLFILAHEHYLAEFAAFVLETDRKSAIAVVDALLVSNTQSGYLAFNIFIDLFLCTLLAFGLIYRPKKYFQGKKIVWFRLLALVPILYEIASFTLKLLSAFGTIRISPYLFPLLTTKPPMTFVVFVVISLFIKMRERIYRKRGKTHEQYNEFLQTKANSWQFAKFAAIIMVVAGILDLIIHVALTIAVAMTEINVETTEEAATSLALLAEQAVLEAGVGGSGPLIVAAPIILLFSYTRKHKKSMLGLIIPVVAIVVILFIYLEGLTIMAKQVGSLSALLEKFIGE